MEYASMQQIEKVKKMSRALSIFFKVLQWLLIPIILVVAATIIQLPSESAIKAGKTGVEIGSLRVTMRGETIQEGSKLSAIELKLFSVVMIGNTMNQNVKTFLIIIIAVLSFFIFKILHHLRKLFGNYAVGDIFSGKSIGQIRQLGFSLLFLGGLDFLPLFLFIQNFREYIFSENFHIIGINIPLVNIVSGCIIILISWIMDVGRGIHEENELTV
jgi:hypothetical protein